MAHFVIFNSVAYASGKLRLVVIERIRSLGMTYSEGNNFTVDLGLKPRPDFIFTGSLDDEAKWEAYGRANLFVLPTYSEDFGIVVAEALWAGVPVITTKGTPWQELETHNCGWWIDVGVDSLVTALKSLHHLRKTSAAKWGSEGESWLKRSIRVTPS